MTFVIKDNTMKESGKNQLLAKLLSSRGLVILIVLIFQTFSLATSMEGAKLMASDLYIVDFSLIKIPAYIFLGLTVQGLILFIFFYGKKEIKSTSLIALLLTILISASISTSFFFIYNKINPTPLTKETIALENYRALKSSILQSDIYKSYHDEFKTETAKLKDAEENLAKEDVTGKSIRYDEYRRKRDEAQARLNTLVWVKTIQEDIKQPNSDAQNKNLGNTTDIKAHVETVIFNLPEDIKNDVDKILQEDYQKGIKDLNNTKEYEKTHLTIPFQELFKKNPNAILALGVASFVDIISLIFGIAIETKEKDDSFAEKFKNFAHNLTQLCKKFLPNLVREIGHTIYLFFQALGSLLNFLITGIQDTIQRAFQMFHYTPYTISIKGNRDEFLDNFFNCIELSWDKSRRKPLLNYSNLMSFAQENHSYQSGYKKLINTMLHIEWLIVSDSDFSENRKLVVNDYEKIDHWYHRERSRRGVKNLMGDAHDYHHIIRLPEKHEGNLWFWFKRQLRKIIFILRQFFGG